MNSDIRLKVTFYSHRKRRFLQRRLGAEGVLAFIDLMMACAMNHPSGTLQGMDAEEIAAEAQWEGDAQEFVAALCDVGLIDQCVEGVYRIHDWEEHNAFAANQDKRSAAGRAAANARWNKRLHANACESHCASHESAMPIVQKGNAPYPIPIPIPSPSNSCADLAHEQAHAPEPVVASPANHVVDDPPVYTLPCNGKKPIYHVTTEMHAKLVTAYPGVDVMAEYAKIDAWLAMNPTRRKTHQGMGKFVNSWLGRAQNDTRGHPRQSQPSLFAGLPEPESLSNEECKRQYGY